MNRKQSKQSRIIALLLMLTTFFSSVAVACFSVHDALDSSAAIEVVSDEQTSTNTHSFEAHCHQCTSHFTCHMNGMLTDANIDVMSADDYGQFYYQAVLKTHSILPPTKPPRV